MIGIELGRHQSADTRIKRAECYRERDSIGSFVVIVWHGGDGGLSKQHIDIWGDYGLT